MEKSRKDILIYVIEIYDFHKLLYTVSFWLGLNFYCRLYSRLTLEGHSSVYYICLYYKFAAELQAAWLPLTTSSTYGLVFY